MKEEFSLEDVVFDIEDWKEIDNITNGDFVIKVCDECLTVLDSNTIVARFSLSQHEMYIGLALMAYGIYVIKDGMFRERSDVE